MVVVKFSGNWNPALDSDQFGERPLNCCRYCPCSNFEYSKYDCRFAAGCLQIKVTGGSFG